MAYHRNDNDVAGLVLDASDSDIALCDADDLEAVRETEGLVHVSLDLAVDVFVVTDRKIAQLLIVILGICTQQVAVRLGELNSSSVS